ncbi:DUF2341 domain-containing protein, partial [Candidatus Pacearchaeota archaeon]|nr:DUF2341 domain-containing protein [Candidatus Pacearchaeota archaeon]
SYQSVLEFNFSCLARDNLNIVNVSLYVDGVLNGTDSSGLNGVNYIFNRSLSRGSYEWTCLACDGSSNCAFSSSNRTINVLGMDISEALNPNPVSVGGTVYVSGHVNLSDGTNVSNNSVNVYVNGSLVSGESNWWNNSWDYRQPDSDSNELGFTIETSTCNSSNTIAWVWMNTTGNGNESIYAYYGNANVSLKTDYDNLDDNLIMYLHLDNSSVYGENSTRVYDFSGNGYDGVVSGATWNVSGKFGGGYSFGGDGDYIEIDFDPSGWTDISFSFWTRLDAAGSYPMFVSYGTNGQNNVEMRAYDNSGRVEIVRRADNAGVRDSVSSVGTGWHHFVGISNESTLSLYKDGSLIGRASVASTIDSVGVLRLGRRSDDFSGTYPLTGKMDEVRIYNKVLTLAEILQIYNSTKIYFDSENSHFSEVITDSNGDYNFSITAPSSNGAYSVVVNLTYGEFSGGSSEDLVVVDFPNITSAVAINQSGVVGGDVLIGENVTINVTLASNEGIDKVWVKVWEGAVGITNVIWEGFLSWIGSFWSVTFGTNSTFGFGQVNYTVFANNSGGTVVNRSGNFTIVGNSAPENMTLNLVSVDSLNLTTSDLNCSSVIIDSDGDSLNVTIRWYKNSVLNMSVDYNNSYVNGTVFSDILNSSNTSKGENWSCSLRVFDGVLWSEWENSSELEILNSLPVVTLIGLADWNSTTNRTQELSWSGFDADGDSLIYEVDVHEQWFSGPICDDDRNNDSLISTVYVPTSDWECLYDNGDYYNWSVRATDDSGNIWGDWAGPWHFNLTAEVSISLVASEMNFGSMMPGDVENSSDGAPSPFVLDNDGNVVVNVSLNSTAIWNERSGSSSEYQFKVDNVSSEEGAFIWLMSIVDWFNMPIADDVVGLGELRYNDGEDSAEIDVRLEVPANEAPGVKNAMIVFTGGLAE